MVAAKQRGDRHRRSPALDVYHFQGCSFARRVEKVSEAQFLDRWLDRRRSQRPQAHFQAQTSGVFVCYYVFGKATRTACRTLYHQAVVDLRLFECLASLFLEEQEGIGRLDDWI